MKLITKLTSIDPLKAMANYLMIAIHIISITGLALLFKLCITHIIGGLL